MTNGGRGQLNGKYLPGVVLILVGVIFLAGGGGVFGWLGRFIWAGVLAGLAYWAYLEGGRTDRRFLQLAAIPLAALALASLLPGVGGGALFLAAIGLAFAVVWRRDPSQWWAILPAGTLGTLALVAALGPVGGRIGGPVFLIGLAATFFALTRLKMDPQPWAIYPAAALAVLGLVSFGGGGSWVVPVLLIGAGVVLLYRNGALKGLERGVQGGKPGGGEPQQGATQATPTGAELTRSGSGAELAQHAGAEPQDGSVTHRS